MLPRWCMEIMLCCFGCVPAVVTLSIMLFAPSLISGSNLFNLIFLIILCAAIAFYLRNRMQTTVKSQENSPLNQDVEAVEDTPPKYEEALSQGTLYQYHNSLEQCQASDETLCMLVQQVATGGPCIVPLTREEEAESNPPSYEVAMGLVHPSTKDGE